MQAPLPRFKKVYLEITSACNLRCSFCPSTERPAVFLPVGEFRTRLRQLKPITNRLLFHVKGEPLLHPDLPTLLDLAGGGDFGVHLVTNGTLIGEKGAPLIGHPALEKISFSVHSFEGSEAEAPGYLDPILEFTRRAAAQGQNVVFRFWRAPGNPLLDRIHEAWPEGLPNTVFIHEEKPFIWPSPQAPLRGTSGFCLGLRDQIAVLVDGTVVPCCLDGEGVMALGNLHDQDLASILASPRARALHQGFSERRCVEELCQRCEFRNRFARRGEAALV